MRDHHDKSIYQSGDDATALTILKIIFWTLLISLLLGMAYSWAGRDAPQQYECGIGMSMPIQDVTRI